MRSIASFIGRIGYGGAIFTTLLLTTIIIGSPLKLQAQGIGFYSSNAPPTGIKSFQPLMAK
jgi:hypothetical protein